MAALREDRIIGDATRGHSPPLAHGNNLFGENRHGPTQAFARPIALAGRELVDQH